MPYTVNGVEYDFDSCVNQRIKQDFVNREVMCCMTSEVEYILRLANELSGYDAPFTEEDVSNYFVKECDKCGSQYGFVPFPVSWTVKMKKKQKETQDILSYHTQAAGCSDKARAKASGGRQPIEECGRTGL